LSLFLHGNNATILDALSHIDSLKTKLVAIKTENDTSLAKFFESYDDKNEHNYKGVQIVQNDSSPETLAKMRCQFLPSLSDDFEQRFPAADFLQAVSCLNPQMWPQHPLKRALFGDRSVAQLSRYSSIPSSEAAVDVVDYGVFMLRLANQTYCIAANSDLLMSI